MIDLKIDTAFWDYDQTRALADGHAALLPNAPIVTQIIDGESARMRLGLSAEVGALFRNY